MPDPEEFAARTALGAVMGGVTAEMAGGDFAQGAFQGALTAALAMIANDLVHDIIDRAVGTVLGNIPGDIFTIGGSYGHMLSVGSLGIPVPLGIAGSFDRVIMGDGKADWFFTFGAGISGKGFSIQADRGKIGKANAACGDEYNLIKSDVGGWTFSFNAESLIAGVEIAHNVFNPTEVVTVKAGPRISALKPGVNIMVNYTFDLPF
jgi:hypothetical protein